jgi:two-component system sensor histidine kinase AgrC
MQSIGGYIFSEDMYGLKTYYSKLSNDFIEYKNLSYLNPKTINNPAIYALISSKFNKASDLKISFKLETFLDFNTLKISIYDFCKILGILLDNAIEASMECENKIINLIIRYDKRNNIQLLHIENSYLNSNLDCSKIFEKNFTTKPHNTGLRFMGNQKNKRKTQKFEFNYRDK